MSRSGKFSPGRGSSKKNKSLGAIEEDNVLLSALDEADPEEGEGGIFSRHELFESELSQIDGQAEDTESRPGTSVFIDLEAEERAFVSGSQQYLDAVETIRQLRQRLVRRTSIIDEIRKYYLRDVVTIKHIMKDILTAREREQVLKVYDENLPSIDLTQALKLHAPTKCELQVAQCGECGGQLEIVMKDSDEVDMLKKTIMDCKDRESRFRIKLATLDAQIENTLREKAEGNKSHAEEKKFLYAEMKKVKAEVERVQKEVSALNKTNKRAQAENEQLRTQLVTVAQASAQLAQQTEEIDSLRSELHEVSTALKTSRQLEKTANKELGERTLELKTLVIQSEEQVETIKVLKKESTDAVTQINSLKVSLSGWVARHAETTEECKNTLERANELEAQVAFYASEKERLLTMADASDETLQGRLIEAEEGCAEYKEENRRVRKDVQRIKRQLEKSEDSRLVLAHELEVLQYEKKQSDEELLSMQNFIHTKIPIPTASAEAVAESAKAVDVLLQSIKVEARQRAGEAPVASARVASVKLQRQERAEARAQREGDTSEVRIDHNRDTGADDDDDIGNFDSELDTQAYEKERDEEDRRSVVSATTKKGHKTATKKKERPTPIANNTRAGGAAGKTKKSINGRGKRRPSLDLDSQDPHDAEEDPDHELVSGQEQATGETEGIAEHQGGEGEVNTEGTAKPRPKKNRPSKLPSHPPTKGSKRPKSRETTSSTEATPVKGTKGAKAKSTEKSGDGKRTGRRSSFGNDESPSRQGSRPGSRPTTRGSATGGVQSRRSSLQTEERLSTTQNDAAGVEAGEDRGDDLEDGATGTGQQSGQDSINIARTGDESDADGDDADEEKQDTGRQNEGGEESRVSSAGGGRRSAGSRIGKSPKSTARSHKSSASEDLETASMGSREGTRRIRSTTPNKREITSQSIKAAAKELPELVSARDANKKTVTQITPVLDKEHGTPRLKKTMARRSSRSSSHGYSDDEEEGEREQFADIDEEEARSEEDGEGDDQLATGLNTGATNTAANSDEDEDEGEGSSEGGEDEERVVTSKMRTIAEKSKKHQTTADSRASVKAQKAPSVKIQVAAYDLGKKKSSSKHSRVDKESGMLSPLAMGSPTNSSGAPFMPQSPLHGSVMPPPKRRRSLPKCYSFSRPITGLGSRLPSMDSADAPSVELSLLATAGCSPALGREAGEGDNMSHNSYASGPTGAVPDPFRIAQLHDEFTAGVHRVPDPPSIRDEDGLREGARIRTYVPIIPIEVKRYVDPTPAANAAPKKKFVLPVEELVELEPLPEGHTALEEQLRVDLLKSLSQAAGVKPNDMHRAVNATKEVLHSLCVLHEASVKSAWSALQTSRSGLDLHYLMRHVAEGMARCADGKTGTVELAETVKRLLPLAGMSMAGPAVSNKWQEELKLNPALVGSLFPAINPASGKYIMKDASEFFNTKTVGPTNTGVLRVLQEKAQLAEESAQQMRTYAASCSKFVTDKLSSVLKDWAKAKGAFYEMDSKIAAEKEKVRKVLEARIGELTKEKVGLSTVVLKHEERIKALESTEAQLQSTQFQLKKVTGEVQGQLDTIRDLEDSLSELHDEVYQRKTKEKELGETIESLSADIGTLQLGQEALRGEVSKEQATLQDTKVVLEQVSEERDHFQAQYERMVRQEDSRLNKLVHVQIQSEPAVRDLAIQTEFVAPPMTLRTIVASKNARGGVKAPLIMSQSLEVPSSCEPGALTSVMVDTLSSTFHPMSRPGTVMTANSSTGARPPGSSGGVFSQPSTAGSLLLPIGGLGTPPGSSLHRWGGTGGGALSARSVLSIDSAGLYPGPLGVPSPFPPQEVGFPSSPPRSVVSREDSFMLNASDFLSSALPIDYEKSNRGLTSTEQMARLLSNVGDESSVGSSRTHNSSKFPKKKAVKVGRLGGDKAGSSGHYQHVHLEESVPQWGSVHGPPSGGTRVDPGVVLGISGVGGVGSHASKVYGTKGEFGANSGHVNGNSTLSAAGSSLFRTSSNPNAPPPRGTGGGREVEVNLPEVRTQSYNLPAQRVNHFSGAVPVVRAQQQPLLNLALEGRTEDHPPSGDSLHLMLDSPSRSLGGSSAYPGFDFERDRRNPLRIAGGDLPASQEAVQGIIYNNRSIPGGSFQQAAYHTADEGYSDNTGYSSGGSKNLLQSASQGSLSSAQLQKTNAARLNQKIHSQQSAADSAHSAVSGVSEEVLKRLRKELLSP